MTEKSWVTRILGGSFFRPGWKSWATQDLGREQLTFSSVALQTSFPLLSLPLLAFSSPSLHFCIAEKIKARILFQCGGPNKRM